MAREILIVGGGEVGADLAALLVADGHVVQVIEILAERAAKLQAQLGAGRVTLGSGTDPAVLETAGVRRAQVVAVVTGSDEVNLVSAGLARFEFGAPRVIGRVNNPGNAWLYSPLMGVDEALNQSDLVARLIVEEMSLAGMLTLLKLQKGDYSLVEESVAADGAAAGRAVRDLPLPVRCVLAGVIRDGELVPPRGDTVLAAGDEVLAVVHASARAELISLLGPPEGRVAGPG